MKKHVQMMLLLVAILLPGAMRAQDLVDYTFSSGVDEGLWMAVPASSPTLINPNSGDNGVSTVQDLGFTFPFGDGVYSQFSVNSDGNLKLGSSVTGTGNYGSPFSSANASINNPKINMLGCDGYCSTNHYVRYLHTVDANGDSLGVVEFCMGTYSTTTRENLYKWQVQLYHNGDIRIVMGPDPSIAPSVARQMGLCTSAADGWIITSDSTATTFTSGTSLQWASGTWTTAYTYYFFDRPVITCPKVTDIAFGNHTSTTVEVSWTEMGEATSWVIEYDTAEFTPGAGQGTVVDAYDTMYTLTDLLPYTYYYVALRADCGGGDTSLYRTATFRTHQACPANYTFATTSIGTTGASFGWSYSGEVEYTPSSFAITVSDTTGSVAQSVTDITDYGCVVGGLAPSTDYIATLTPTCNGSTTAPITLEFSTNALPCMEYDSTTAFNDTITGSSYTSNYSVPVNNYYGNTFSEQLFTADELSGPSVLTGIEFEYAYSSPMTQKNNCTIYVAETAMNTISSSSYVAPENMTKVYTGPLNCSNGWNYFPFETSYSYTGGNLVVAVVDNSGAYNSSSYVWGSHSASGKAMVWYSDGERYPSTSMIKTNCSYRTNTILHFAECTQTNDCVAPLASVVSVDAYNITIGWTAGYQETNWDVQHRVAGSNAWIDDETSIASTSYTFSELTPATDYEIRVFHICNGDTVATVISQRTECAPMNYISENFESYSTGQTMPISPCWQKFYQSSSNPVSNSYPYPTTLNGTKALYFYAYGSGTSVSYRSWVAMNEMADSLSVYELEFDVNHTSTSAYYRSELIIGTMTDPSDFSTFDSLTTVQSSVASLWESKYFSFENYHDTLPRYIAFYAPAPNPSNYASGYTYGYNYIYLDNVVVSRRSSCPRITRLHARDITNTTAEVAWDANDEYGAVKVVYGTSENMADAIDSVEVYENHAAITNLNPSTTYYVWATAICAEEESRTMTCSFTTANPCNAAVDLTLVNVGLDAATFSWSTDPVTPATSYIFEWKADSVNTWNREVTSGAYYMLSGLSEGVAYSVRVYAVCSDDTANASTLGFTTTVRGMVGADAGTYYLPIYPYYNYSISEQMILADEMAIYGDTINGIYFNSTSSIYGRDVKCYVGNTTLNDLSTGSYLSSDSLTLVYDGTWDINSGWVELPFTTPFVRDNSKNLCILVYDHTGEYESFSGFVASNSAVHSLYAYNDNNPYSTTNLGGLTSVAARPLMRLNATMQPVECEAPHPVVTNATDSQLQIAWLHGLNETSWKVEYRAMTDTAWSILVDATADTFATVNGLEPATNYAIRVSSLCGSEERGATITAFTACGEFSVPYSEDFNAMNSDDYVINPCWTKGGIADSAPYTVNITDNGMMMLMPVGSYVIFPEMNADVNTLQFKCNYVVADASIYSLVGICSHPSDILSFTIIDTLWANEAGVPLQVTVPFDSYEETSGNIAIYSPFNQTYYDNIVIEAIPQCGTADSLMADNITTTTAEISWVGSNGASSYIMEYGPRGFVHGTGTRVSVSATSSVLAGLHHSTSYEVILYTVCASLNDTSSASNPLYFTTECDVVDSLPYFIDFDHCNAPALTYTGVMPNCWNYQMLATGTYAASSYLPQLYSDASYAASGSFSLRLGGTTVVTLPEMPVGIDSLMLSFHDYTTSVANYGLIIGVCDSNTPGCEQSFVPVDTIRIANSSADYTTYALAGYTGSGRYIAFKNYYGNSSYVYDYSYHYIDNVMVDYLPSCIPVYGPYVAGSTMSSLTLAWTDLRPSSEWEIAYSTSPLSNPATGSRIIANSNPYTINGLSDTATYYMYVRNICGSGDTSIWSSVASGRPGSYVMRANMVDTVRMCGGTIYDDGGATGVYSSSQNSTIIIMPDAPVSAVAISGSSYTESSFDYVTIYDGIGTSGTQLWSDYGVSSLQNFGPFESNDPSGAITVVFQSDGSVTYDGFEINVSCVSTSCRTYNVRIDPSMAESDVALNVTWDNNAGEYQIEYGAMGFEQGTGTMLTSNTNHVTINGLESLTKYDVYVRGICSASDTGSWAKATLTTALCGNSATVFNYDSTSSFTTTSYFPGYSTYNYSVSQTIIDSAELAVLDGREITAFAFTTTGVDGGTYYNDCEVYLSHTTMSEFNEDEGVDLDSTAVLVYQGDLNYSTAGLQLFGFDTTFAWDGVSNVILTVLRHNGSWASGTSFEAVEEVGDKGFYSYSDDDDPTPSTITTYGGYAYTTSNVAAYQLIACGANCPVPVIVSTLPTYNSAAITWSSNATDFEVSYKSVSDADYTTPVAVAASNYTLTGLTPATQYTFRVRSVCDSGAVSDWASVNFTTDSLPCFAPEALHQTAVSYTSVTLDWTNGGEEQNWVVKVFNSRIGEILDTVSAHPATISGLTANEQYFATVQAACGSNLDGFSEWSDTISFTTSECVAVSNISCATPTNSSVEISWTSNGSENTWIVEYGMPGFGQGEEMGRATATSNPYQLSLAGLDPNTTYEVYVYAQCMEGLTSVPAGPASFTTNDIGISGISGNADINIYPNPTSGSTTISVSGISGKVNVAIVDMNGREVMNSAMECDGDCEKVMNVEGLAQGAYFVRIYGEEINSIRKLIVR